MNEVSHTISRHVLYPPPSILVVADTFPHTQELKQKLENNNWQVYWTDTSTDGLAIACQKYFDLIVLNLEGPNNVDDVELCKKLKAMPELASIPMVLLTICDYAKEALGRLEIHAPVYCLAKDTFSETMLRQIIEQIHYLTYRYV